MKVPKYIKDLLHRRAKYGELVSALESEFWYWIYENGLDKALLDGEFSNLYGESSILLITEPKTLTKRQIEIIENYNNNKE
jgi:hypothetical protein